jgi:hypothetical protein
MPEKREYAEQITEAGIGARKEFDSVDKEINGSAARIMKAFADLAEQKPEEVFGLKPTERDRFFADALMAPAVLRAAAGGNSAPDTLGGGTVEGSNPLAVGAIAEALAKVASSEGGAKIVEEILNHIRAEKEFFKETGKEIFDWAFGDE